MTRNDWAELAQCLGWRPYTNEDAYALGFIALVFSGVGFSLGLHVLKRWFR